MSSKTFIVKLSYSLFAYFRSMKQLIIIGALFSAYSAVAQPGWQQRVDTKIDVTLDDKRHMLYAFEELTYTNNSPDTLKFIYVHLWMNAYKNDHTPFARQQDENRSTAFYYSKKKDRGFIDSLQFTIDGHSVDHDIAEATPDIARIDLPKPLLPGKQVKIATPFRVKLPIVFSRNGHTGQAYFVSQWFPKPAVYDKLGWHPISYLDQGEFYSDFGSYDVSVTLPANYVVMATGNCMDEKENKWLDERAKDSLPSDTLYKKSWPASAPETKTVHFREDNVHDFAWFADKRWIVRKDTVVSPGNNEVVTTWSAFMPAYQDKWKKANEHLKAAIRHYGKWVGPYPYKTIKAVLGDMRSGGGMEYPTITLIDKTSGAALQTVVIHEAGHNWFYGMLASNERDHAWMDEGINTFYEQKTTEALKHDSGKAKKKSGFDETLIYYERAAIHTDQAIEQTSANFEKLNYGLDVYYKTALALRWLESYMGEEDFEQGMKDYYNTWHHRHPYPEDFETCMQRHTAKPIDWFFDTILTTDKKIDYTITKARVNGSNTEVTIRNNTGVYAPAYINAHIKDSLVAGAWTQPFVGKTTITLPVTNWKTLKIDGVIPDGKSANDVYRRKALFHHFGLQLRTLAGLNTGEKDRIYVLPSYGYNRYDGNMAGLLFHNLTLPQNRLRFAVTPMYAFAAKSVVGAGSVGYLWYPENVFKEIMLQADAKMFHYSETKVNLPDALYAGYMKVAPSLNFTFNEHDARSPVSRQLLIKGYSITEQEFDFGTDPTGKPVLKEIQNMYGLLRYEHANGRTYNPFRYSAEGHMAADFAKINVEASVRINYNTPRKALSIRGYLGKYFAINDDPAVTARYALNSSFSGVNDYLYDGTYLGRNARNGISAQQISTQEGGFKIPVFGNVDRSDNWMATINLKTDLPLVRLPIRLFFDAGLIPNATPGFKNAGSTTLLYDGGVQVELMRGVMSVYFPLIMSSDFQNYLDNTFGRKNVYTRAISFTFMLQNANWLKTPSKLVQMAGG
jgi:hypothetical protein